MTTQQNQTREAVIALSPVQSTVQITKELNMAGYNRIDRVDYQEALIQAVQARKPQIIIVTSELPGRKTMIEMFSEIAEASPNTKIIFISKSIPEEIILNLYLAANLCAWLLSERSDRTLSFAIESAEAGQLFLDFVINKSIRNLISEKQSVLTNANANFGNLELLTEREAEVLKYLCEGLNYKSVAQKLFISESTVKTHINNVFTKLKVNDRTQAVLYALRHDLESLMRVTMNNAKASSSK
ncbi:MAG: response regulator transcription factor [Cyanobacteria bacterium]|nr:response regulator transcription factor [Cyanobacteriota bacterium]